VLSQICERIEKAGLGFGERRYLLTAQRNVHFQDGLLVKGGDLRSCVRISDHKEMISRQIPPNRGLGSNVDAALDQT
jgi:hypothetical protein